MSQLDYDIGKIIKKIKIRIQFSLIINYMIIGLGIGCIVSIGLVFLSKFIPVYQVYAKTAVIIGVGVLGGIVFSLFKIPKDIYAALKVDSFGLKERVVTAVELRGNEEVFSKLQKKDALDELKKLNYKKQLSLKPRKKFLLAMLGSVICLGLTIFLPDPLKNTAIERHNLKETKKQAVKEIKKVEKKIDKNNEISDWQKVDVKEKLAELKKDIQSAKSNNDVNKSIQKNDKKLEFIKQQYTNENLEKIADTLMKNDMTKELGKLIKNGNRQELMDAVRKEAQQLKKASPQQIKQLSEQMKELAQELKNNPELAKAMMNLSMQLAQGNMNAGSQALKEMGEAVSQLMQNQDYREAIGEIQQALKQTMSNSNQQGQQNTQSSEDNGQGQNGNNSGNGQGNGKGTGKGQGTGTGSGAGEESSMGSENSPEAGSESTGLSKKNGNNGKKVSDYDKVFTPKTIGGEGDTSVLKGQKNNSGTSEEMITEKGMGIKGNSVPYNKVIGEYKNRAYENVENTSIPEGMKEVVKNYFSSLEE